MMSGLSTISDAAFDMLLPSYDNVLNELEARKEAWVKPNAWHLRRMNPSRRTTRS